MTDRRAPGRVRLSTFHQPKGESIRAKKISLFPFFPGYEPKFWEEVKVS